MTDPSAVDDGRERPDADENPDLTDQERLELDEDAIRERAAQDDDHTDSLL
jgi:hypothetical protein